MPSVIETKGVTEGAFQYIKVHIITGHIAPGFKLNSFLTVARNKFCDFGQIDGPKKFLALPFAL
jgi:hypothetical protein